MDWYGATPKVFIDNDVTPVASDKCYCGSELIYVDSDEKPPLEQDEINLQFHCLASRGGDWEFCNFHGETWVRMARR